MTGTGDEALNRVLTAWVDLGRDERRVLAEVATRLLQGRSQYGDLVLREDVRDWDQEAYEEATDLLVYRVCKRLSRRAP